jgi:quercetin dioxygenase-like cupin family protein
MSTPTPQWFHVPPADESGQLRPDTIVSRSLLVNADAKVVRFSFAAGQELSEHTAPVAALLCQLSGAARWVIGGEAREVGPGDWAFMPPNVPHSLQASEDCVVLLILLRKSTATG